MTVLDGLRKAAKELELREARSADARNARDELIVQACLETDLTYEEIGESVGLSMSAVWKIATHAGVSRQRVRQLPEAASG